MAPRKAKILVMDKFKNLTELAKIRPTVAPNAAPAETPIMYGSAIGFLKTPWKITPEPERAIPTMTAISILGSLMSNITLKSCGLISDRLIRFLIPGTADARVFKVVLIERLAAPAAEDKIIRTTRIINKIIIYFTVLKRIFFKIKYISILFILIKYLELTYPLDTLYTKLT